MFYEVTIEADSFWRNLIDLAPVFVTAFVGTSPADQSDDAARVLVAGKRIVVFVRQADLAWRESGTRAALLASGAYQGVYWLRDDDSLVCAEGDDDRGFSRCKHLSELRSVVADSNRARQKERSPGADTCRQPES
jgi:hypothetical protein